MGTGKSAPVALRAQREASVADANCRTFQARSLGYSMHVYGRVRGRRVTNAEVSRWTGVSTRTVRRALAGELTDFSWVLRARHLRRNFVRHFCRLTCAWDAKEKA